MISIIESRNKYLLHFFVHLISQNLLLKAEAVVIHKIISLSQSCLNSRIFLALLIFTLTENGMTFKFCLISHSLVIHQQALFWLLAFMCSYIWNLVSLDFLSPKTAFLTFIINKPLYRWFDPIQSHQCKAVWYLIYAWSKSGNPEENTHQC